MENTKIRYGESKGSTDRGNLTGEDIEKNQNYIQVNGDEADRKRGRCQQRYPLNMIRLCIDGCKEDLQGRIFSPMSLQPLIFTNCSEMFVKADQLFDEKGYPQAFQERRSFRETKAWKGRYAPPVEVLGEAEITMQDGKYLTLDIIVQSRMRTGWQGMVFGRDGTKISEYRSELELLNCIVGALQNSTENDSSKS